LIDGHLYASLAAGAYNKALHLTGFTPYFVEDIETDTQVFILIGKSKQYVVFRGTEKSIKDIKTDLAFKTVNGTHSGFKRAYDSVSSQINQILQHGKMTVFIGHSLGGALAMIANSMHLSKYKSCFTFGAPRVFDKKQAAAYNEFNEGNTVRFESAGDPVPYLPSYLQGFRHVGKCIYIKKRSLTIDPLPVVPFFSMLFCPIHDKIEAHSIQNYVKLFDKSHNKN